MSDLGALGTPGARNPGSKACMEWEVLGPSKGSAVGFSGLRSWAPRG